MFCLWQRLPIIWNICLLLLLNLTAITFMRWRLLLNSTICITSFYFPAHIFTPYLTYFLLFSFRAVCLLFRIITLCHLLLGYILIWLAMDCFLPICSIRWRCLFFGYGLLSYCLLLLRIILLIRGKCLRSPTSSDFPTMLFTLCVAH